MKEKLEIIKKKWDNYKGVNAIAIIIFFVYYIISPNSSNMLFEIISCALFFGSLFLLFFISIYSSTVYKEAFLENLKDSILLLDSDTIECYKTKDTLIFIFDNNFIQKQATKEIIRLINEYNMLNTVDKQIFNLKDGEKKLLY